jgi:hypothetical protein
MKTRHLLTVLTIAVAGLISPSHATAQSQEVATVTLPTPPAAIGPYKRDTSENLGAAAGWLHRYSGGNSGRVSVFVYPVPGDVKEGTTDPRTWTNREGEKFKELLAIQKDQKAIQDFIMAIERADSAMNGAEVIPGHFAAAATRGPGRNNFEFCLVHYVKGVFVKVRATIPPADVNKSDAYGFADLLARIIARGG